MIHSSVQFAENDDVLHAVIIALTPDCYHCKDLIYHTPQACAHDIPSQSSDLFIFLQQTPQESDSE